MDITVIVIVSAALFAWGLGSNKLERADLTGPIAFIAVGLALAGFELIEDGLGARIDPSRPATIRAHVPARDLAAADRAVAIVTEALGHLQAFGLRPIGELRTRLVEESDWAEAWKEHFHVLRIGRRLVIKPSWRRHAREGDEVVIEQEPCARVGAAQHDEQGGARTKCLDGGLVGPREDVFALVDDVGPLEPLHRRDVHRRRRLRLAVRDLTTAVTHLCGSLSERVHLNSSP